MQFVSQFKYIKNMSPARFEQTPDGFEMLIQRSRQLGHLIKMLKSASA